MLTAADLNGPRLQQAKTNHETYKLLLDQCYQQIRRCNERRVFFTQYAVPNTHPGRPNFKHEHAIDYLEGKLLQGDFVVVRSLSHKNVLTISWQHARATSMPIPQRPATSKPRNDSRLLRLLRAS